jgi:hypothetical protein
MSDGLAVEGIASATYSGKDGFSLLRGGVVSERVAKTVRASMDVMKSRTGE